MNAARTVFSDARYVILSCAIFAPMLAGLLLLGEYVFVEPYFVSHLPPGSELGLVLIVALCALSALVIPMNVYRIVALKSSRQRMGGGVLGSVVGAAAGACGCGPVGFAVISTFGTAGATATAFLTNYELPIRLAAIAVLAVSYVATARSLRTECRIGQR
ncbi:conserved membrane hypothetical protein [Nitrosopumilaceae archaeon]|nr:hypothetical protein [Nitrosopumilus sp.]CAI9831219.1 conserved membrane hypothetical protein [Nitrosopumilaceae archaeon]MDA7940752.1 hypothetical protein [Nitrosopumilus sp.]MDA7942960.1 hypothetical protein [Nitrosopumilus sp.]MDA7944629.1 hypothetical protein [Nitrosopumilus sp.]